MTTPIEITEEQLTEIRAEVRNEIVNDENYRFATTANKRDIVAISNMRKNAIHNTWTLRMFATELILLLTISLGIWIK